MMADLMNRARAHLLVVDMQEKLVPAMADADATVDAVGFLIEVAKLCGVPVTLTEQYPNGLGHTVAALAEKVQAAKRFEKTAFSALGDKKCGDHLRAARTKQRRDQIVVCGVEAHVCVSQTALDLKGAGFEVFVAADAISSRALGSRDVALSRLARAGIAPVTTEMVGFEWVGDASDALFKPLSQLVKARS